ncbi:MAG: hypothetical protein KDC24_11685, partial [Saprospiraceae bacterium]|nr:hypothetical protein [Saprospiraceae bacterium]
LKDSTQNDLLLLGCSFTYGFGVNENGTFAALMQASMPEWKVRNKAVIGYGTVQSLLQLEDYLTQDTPEMVVLVFSSFHLMRNSLSPAYRHNLKVGYQRSSSNVYNLMDKARFTYVQDCDLVIKFASWDSLYQDWPGRNWLASVNWFQTLQDRFNENTAQQIAVTTCLLQQMHTLCRERNIPFGVVCLDSTKETDQVHDNLRDVSWQDLGFDFDNPELTNQPYDSHPNAAGHEYIANRVIPFIKAMEDGN